MKSPKFESRSIQFSSWSHFFELFILNFWRFSDLYDSEEFAMARSVNLPPSNIVPKCHFYRFSEHFPRFFCFDILYNTVFILKNEKKKEKPWRKQGKWQFFKLLEMEQIYWSFFAATVLLSFSSSRVFSELDFESKQH